MTSLKPPKYQEKRKVFKDSKGGKINKIPQYS
jgi:hypothetical protein